MDRQSKKLGLGIAVGVALIASVLYLGSIDPKTNAPESITVGEKTIEFTWTDENSGEDLIIWTDQQTYTNGLSHAEVYVAVHNTSNKDQEVELLGYFSDSKQRIDDIKVLQEFTVEGEPIYEDVCSEIEVDSVSSTTRKAVSTTTRECVQTQIGTTTPATVLKWAEMETIERNAFEITKEIDSLKGKLRKSSKSFNSNKKSAGYVIPSDSVIYYKVTILYPTDTDGQFFLEAVGDKGSYGHLDPWFDGDWDYRVSVTIESDEVDSTLSNFPVYVDLSDLPSDFHTNVKSDGCDIRVVESDEETETAFELVSYNSGSDTGELHFLADSLSSSADTTFYIYYGNSGASCYATNSTYGAEAVWANYHFVSHDGGITDSTGNGVQTNNGSVDETSVVAIGGNARYFTADWITSNINTNSVIGTSNFSASSWFKVPNANDRRVFIGMAGSTSAFQDAWSLDAGRNSDSNSIRVTARDGTTGEAKLTGATGFRDDNWHLAVANRSGTTANIYVDGGFEDSGTNAEFGVNVGQYLQIGRVVTFNTMTGYLDEIRLGNSVLSADWIASEYVNQSNTTAFYTPGAQESNGGGGESLIDALFIFGGI